MRRLPVFSTVGKAIGFTFRNIWPFITWLPAPALASGALSAALLLLSGPVKNLPSANSLPLLLGFFFLIILVLLGLVNLLIWMPYCVRINQLAVLGRVEPGNYFRQIFTARSLRYLKYMALLVLLTIAGYLATLLPILLASLAKAQNSPGTAVLALLGPIIYVTFFILITPFALVAPAAAVDDHPSLAKAYQLGKHCKLRLFLCSLLGMVCVLIMLGILLAAATPFINMQQIRSQEIPPVMWIVQIPVLFLYYVLPVVIQAMAYRILSGLPDPNAPAGAASPSGPAATTQHGQGAGI